jgi:predicted esterase
LKNLQERQEETWTFQSFAELKGIVRRVERPQELILLLHGLGERGKRIYRKLLSSLPENALVLAPNAPFPIPRKEGKNDFGYSWYFYDKVAQEYFIRQDLAKFWLRDLVKLENPNRLPVTIVGFSQGGYLAPVVAQEIPECKLVVGLSCEFRTHLITKKPEFKLIALHGKNDSIVSPNSAKVQIESLEKKGISIDFHLIDDTAHEISANMAKHIQFILETNGKAGL